MATNVISSLIISNTMNGRDIFHLTFAGEIGEQGQKKEIQPRNEYI